MHPPNLIKDWGWTLKTLNTAGVQVYSDIMYCHKHKATINFPSEESTLQNHINIKYIITAQKAKTCSNIIK